ncbi:MAG: glycoside hydrolase family 78 protein [Tannerella sp.]|jgi:alpha-L-rhamnosidase|nr:glycoside hydrolase family 78 protein [Tannerella sp.]
MNRISLFLLITVAGFLISCNPKETTSVTVVDPTCEYLVNPLGIDVVQPRLGWKIRQTADARNGQLQTAWQVMVASSPEQLAAGNGDLWDSGKVKSAQSIQVAYQGKPLESMQQCWWKVRIWNNHGEVTAWSQPARWGMGLLQPSDWQAQWIGDQPDLALKEYVAYVYAHHDQPDFDVEKWKNPPTLPSPMLRKSFGVNGEVKQAFLYVSALGYYEMWINGARIGSRQLAPEWTDYNYRVQYQTYDLTEQVKPGENVLAAVLADGWSTGCLAGVKWMRSFPHRGFYNTDRRLIARLAVEYADGSREVVTTDGSWKINPDGFIRSADNFAGQTIDARKIIPGWDQPGFDDSAWENVYTDSEVNKHLTAQINEPIRIHQALKPVRVWAWKDKYLVDFGQNIAGWCALKIKGRAGTAVTLRHGEWLDNDGSVYTASLGYAKATDVFILSGGEDVFEPHFTYHGFQYVEISGLEAAPSPDMITAKAVSSDPEVTGSFECSNPELNLLFGNILWTQRNNMFSVLTDNPSRDERTGALGDAQIFCRSSMFNMNMAAFYTKIVQDLREGGVAPNGQFFSMAPTLANPPYWEGFIGAPGWAEAGIIIPWRMFEYYADVRALADIYEAMKGHVDAILTENPGLIWRVRHNHNNDWLNANTISNPPESDYNTKRGAIPDDVFSTAFFACAARMVSTIAVTLDHPADATHYGELADRITDLFVKSYVSPDGKVEGHSQAAYALALNYDLLPENLRDAAFAHLLACIEEYDYRISTGFITTPMLMEELVVRGRTDIAYRLLESDRFPSWLYPVKQGATTIWERWDAYVKGRGILSGTMNSFDHFAFGSVAEWMYRNILGINPDIRHPGYAHFTIHPRPGGTLTWAKGSYNSIRGEIASSWKIEDGQFTLDVKIPANTTATIVLPDGETKEAGSGEYRFKAKLRVKN